MDQVEVMKNKRLRGQVLRTLTLFYPSKVDVSGVKSGLLTRGMVISADISKVLHYLKDKGYIKTSESKITEFEDSDLVELTAKGVDLIEGTITDAGVDI